MNTSTQRVFIAATQQNDGKTTTAVGLFAALRKRLGRIGFIKPVGQRFIEVEGKQIDEDSVLIDQTFGSSTMPSGARDFHAPRVKSGTFTG